MKYKWKVAFTTALLFAILEAGLIILLFINMGFAALSLTAYCYFNFGLASLLVKLFGDQIVFLLLIIQPPLFLFLLGFLEGRYVLSKIKKPLLVFFFQIVAFFFTTIVLFAAAIIDPYGMLFKPGYQYDIPHFYLNMAIKNNRFSEPHYLNFQIRRFGRLVSSPSFVEGNTRHKIPTINIHETGRICVYKNGERIDTKTLGEFRIVFSDIMLYREDPPFDMEMGKDILECCYKEEALYKKDMEKIIFSSDSPESIRVTVNKLSLVKDPKRIKHRSMATTENTLYRFEGTFEATFLLSSESSADEQVRKLNGGFNLKWEKSELGSE